MSYTGTGLGGLSSVFTRIAPSLGTQPDSFVMPLIAGIIVVFMIIAIVYVVIQYRRSGAKKLTKGPIDLFAPKSPVVVDRESTKSIMKASYTLAFYVQLDAVPDMRAAATPLFTWPGVWNMNYSPSQEQMIWTFTQTRGSQPVSPFEPPPTETVVLPTVPLQRWVQIVIGFEGRSVDLYVNGALVKSELLSNLPAIGASSITIVPNNVMGKLAYIQVWPRRLPISEVAANYTDTSDSQGRPFLGPEFFDVFKNLRFPNLFCPNGDCTGAKPSCAQSQTWEFPYA